MTDLKSALFLDLEACSIHPESWPIEIGIARIESGQVLSDSRLIRPTPGWDLDLWSVVCGEREHAMAFPWKGCRTRGRT
jgi:hypothetical protein